MIRRVIQSGLLWIVCSIHIRHTYSNSNSIPRSHRSQSHGSNIAGGPNSSPHPYPPWNPSKKINSDGFLYSLYPLCPGEWEKEASLSGRHSGPQSRRTLHKRFVQVRQVPGDGNCLFHSISTCLSLAINGTHTDMHNTTSLSTHSSMLRSMAVDCLSGKPRRTLFLQGEEYLRAKDLVEAAAAQYNMTGEKYCDCMKKDSYWGGGPEIVALCNVLRRPIHVYELTEDSPEEYSKDYDDYDEGDSRGGSSTAYRVSETGFRLRRMACFGSPKFDRREPLHILSADSRFPDVTPGRQLASGNHFLALFPVNDPSGKHRRHTTLSKENVRVRGGRSIPHRTSTDAVHNRRRNHSARQGTRPREEKHHIRVRGWMDRIFGTDKNAQL